VKIDQTQYDGLYPDLKIRGSRNLPLDIDFKEAKFVYDISKISYTSDYFVDSTSSALAGLSFDAVDLIGDSDLPLVNSESRNSLVNLSIVVSYTAAGAAGDSARTITLYWLKEQKASSKQIRVSHLHESPGASNKLLTLEIQKVHVDRSMYLRALVSRDSGTFPAGTQVFYAIEGYRINQGPFYC